MATLKRKSETEASTHSPADAAATAGDSDEEMTEEELDETFGHVHQAPSESIPTKRQRSSSDIDIDTGNAGTDDTLPDGKILRDFKNKFPEQSFDAIKTWKDYLTVESQWFCFDRAASVYDKNADVPSTDELLDLFNQSSVGGATPSKRENFITYYSSSDPSQFSDAFKSAILCFVQQEENNDILRSKNDECKVDWNEFVYEISDAENSYLLNNNKTSSLATESGEHIEQLGLSRDWLLIPLYVSNHVRQHKKELNEDDNLMLAEVDDWCSKFNWAQLRHLYVEYLRQEDTTLGVPEVALLAEYFGKEVIVYQEAGNVSMPFVFNRGADKTCYILLTEDGDMVGLKLNADKCRLAAYHQFRIRSLQAEFDKRQNPRPPLVLSIDEAEREIIDRMPEMEEFVKLQLLRPQFGTHPGVIQAIAFQLKDNSADPGIADLKYIVQYITDCVLANKATRDVYLTLSLRERQSWLVDIIVMEMEYCSNKIIENIAEFKTLLGSIADINILSLFVKKYKQQDINNRLDEHAIVSVLKTLSENLSVSQSNLNRLASIDLSDWLPELRSAKDGQLCDTHTREEDTLAECSKNDDSEVPKQKLPIVYSNSQEAGHRDEFERMEHEHKQRTTSASSQEEEEHTSKLHDLMRRTRDPQLFASILATGRVPMDAICASALGKVLSVLLGEQCVIRIISKQGWTYCDLCDDPRALVIDIVHDDGHFESGESDIGREAGSRNEQDGAYNGNASKDATIGGSSNGHDKTSNNSSTSKGKVRDYNCLIDAVREKVPKLSIYSNEKLRELIAETILGSEDLSFRIRQGWHREAIECGFYGGGGGAKRAKQDHKDARERMLKAQDRHIKRLTKDYVQQFYNQVETCPDTVLKYIHLKQAEGENFEGKDVTDQLNKNMRDLRSKLLVLSLYCHAVKPINGNKPPLIATIEIAGEEITFGIKEVPTSPNQIFISFLKTSNVTVSHSYKNIAAILDACSDDQRRERASVILAALRSSTSCLNDMNIINSAADTVLKARFEHAMNDPKAREAARELIVLTHVAECASPTSDEVEMKKQQQKLRVSGRFGGAGKLARSALNAIATGTGKNKMTFCQAFNTDNGSFVMCRTDGVKMMKTFLYSGRRDEDVVALASFMSPNSSDVT